VITIIIILLVKSSSMIKYCTVHTPQYTHTRHMAILYWTFAHPACIYVRRVCLCVALSVCTLCINMQCCALCTCSLYMAVSAYRIIISVKCVSISSFKRVPPKARPNKPKTKNPSTQRRPGPLILLFKIKTVLLLQKKKKTHTRPNTDGMQSY
jgi:hypothetical protein